MLGSAALMARFVPDRSGFFDLARRGRLCFVYREVPRRLRTLRSRPTPSSDGAPYSFLLESVVGGEKWAAYSFVGVSPRAVIRARGDRVEVLHPQIDRPGGEPSSASAQELRTVSPLTFVDDYMAALSPAVPPGLPRFFGGAVGWLGYDIVRSFEKLPSLRPDDLELPELCFAITDTVVIFDNLRGTAEGGRRGSTPAPRSRTPTSAPPYDGACTRIDAILERLGRRRRRCARWIRRPRRRVPAPRALTALRGLSGGGLVSHPGSTSAPGTRFQGRLLAATQGRARRHRPVSTSYRALRVTNPSPYMFHLDFPRPSSPARRPSACCAPRGATSRSAAWPALAAAAPRPRRTWRWPPSWAPIPRSAPSTSC